MSPSTAACRRLRIRRLRCRGVALWCGRAFAAADLWLCPAFGDTRAAWRAAFRSPLASHARPIAFDLPGHGDSRPLRAPLTVARAAALWRDLVLEVSGDRPVVLVGHSMAAVIAVRAARLLPRPPLLVVSVEGNLRRADATLTGLAARHAAPAPFVSAIRARTRAMVPADPSAHAFVRALDRADACSLWHLGRSVATVRDPGGELLRLPGRRVHYWDPLHTAAATRAWIENHGLPNRRFEGCGHWPMRACPEAFYRAILRDLLAG